MISGVAYVAPHQGQLEMFIRSPEFARTCLDAALAEGTPEEIERVRYWFGEAQRRRKRTGRC